MSCRPAHGGVVAGTTGTERGSILPLPEEVVAQVKSSITITSLNGVVSELLKNSLDAGADNVEATVDFARGGCSIEDNGTGIAPFEFTAEGGLGRLYCTSKYNSLAPSFGRSGTFLASLGAMSLMTVTSRHHEHQSQNSVTFNHSRIPDRQLPALQQHELNDLKHGTRVTVRNLFGNMPVRVKQRPVAAEHKAEIDRLWDALRREVTALLLSWKRAVSLRVRDADNKTIIRHSEHAVNTSAECTNRDSSRQFAELQHLLMVLTQSNLITANDWCSWIPASAFTSFVSIKGAISLNPAPTKRVQFICLECQPLSVNTGHNELFDLVNRLFSLSSFGTIEDDADLDYTEKLRRKSDKRFKEDGHPNRQLRGQKGVDRHPMFSLRISFKRNVRATGYVAAYLENESNLQVVIETLNTMITQWLSINHFRPREPRDRGLQPGSALNDTSGTSSTTQPSAPQTYLASGQMSLSRNESIPRSSSAQSNSRKRTRPALLASRTQSYAAEPKVFTTWSRIKSGKDRFYDRLWASGTYPKEGSVEEPPTAPATPQQGQNGVHQTASVAPFAVECVEAGSLSAFSRLVASPQHQDAQSDIPHMNNNDIHDDSIVWTNPSTKQDFRLNARTGALVPRELPGSHVAFSRLVSPNTLSDFNKSMRLAQRPAATESPDTPWLSSFLQTWDNPVFKPAEKGIQQIFVDGISSGSEQCEDLPRHGCSRLYSEQAFSRSLSASTSKLSRQGLHTAQVIAQVDKKFVLARMYSASERTSEHLPGAELLVLIDQHAADERIQVEALLAELCTPLPASDCHSQYRSKLGHTSLVAFTILETPIQCIISLQEQDLFVTYADRFALWGLLYDVSLSGDSTSQSKHGHKTQHILSVLTLPPSVSERCKTNPKLLVSFLRSTVWTYADAPNLPSFHKPASPTSEIGSVSSGWLKRLSTCPQGLVDLINSRACRSAIMFNDELSFEACEELVQRLAQCVFPFMCAHGRPSMIPLVEVGKVGNGMTEAFRSTSDFGYVGRESFVSAWKRWNGVRHDGDT